MLKDVHWEFELKRRMLSIKLIAVVYYNRTTKINVQDRLTRIRIKGLIL